MPAIENYLSATDSKVFELSVHLSSLAIGSSVEDLSFLEYRFKEAKWTLYTAPTYRDALLELSRNRTPVVFCECPVAIGKTSSANWPSCRTGLA